MDTKSRNVQIFGIGVFSSKLLIKVEYFKFNV